MQPRDPAVRDTWGNIINAAMPLIEAGAIGNGIIDIGGQSSYTLTVANNGPDQARQIMYPFGGALTTDCTVTIPALARIGWVSNNTSGNRNVILTTGTGSSLTVPAGSTLFWTCDGANISSISIGQPQTINANSGVVTGNNAPYASRDNGGTQRNLLSIGTDNWTNLWMGGPVGWRVLNQSGTTTLLSINPAGSMTVGGPMTVSGPASVSGTLGVTGAAAIGGSLQTGAITGTSAVFSGAVSVGTTFSVSGQATLGSVSSGALTATTTTVGTLNAQATTVTTLSAQATSVTTLTGTSADFASGYTMNNNQAFKQRDLGGTVRNVFGLGNDNWMNHYAAGAVGWRVLNQAASLTLFQVSEAGAFTVPGATSLQSTLSVTGNSTLNGGLTVAGSLGGDTGNSGYLSAGGSTVGAWTVTLGAIYTNSIKAASFVTSSDLRLKEDIHPITPDEGVAYVVAGRPVTFNMRGRFGAGFIAQDERADPARAASVSHFPDDDEAVAVSDGSVPAGHSLTKDYLHDLAYLTAAVQWLVAEVNALRARAA